VTLCPESGCEGRFDGLSGGESHRISGFMVVRRLASEGHPVTDRLLEVDSLFFSDEWTVLNKGVDRTDVFADDAQGNKLDRA